MRSLDYLWIRITKQRVRLLRLMWWGISDIGDLTGFMLTRKNVIVNQLRALKDAGIIEIVDGKVRIVKSPRNLALLLYHGIISPGEYIKELLNYVREEAEASSCKITLFSNSLNITVYVDSGENKETEDVYRHLKRMGFDNVEIVCK